MKYIGNRRIGCLAALAAALLACMACMAGCGQQGEGMERGQQERQNSQSSCQISEENKLIVYTSHKEEVYGPIIREFEERTGIWVQVRAGGTTELLEAIAGEEGQQTCDVMFGGGVESYDAYREYFTPYQCAQKDVLDDTYSSAEGYWTVFSELPIVFIYNNKLVNQEEVPLSWGEFLTDKWKGKIAFADPGMSGTSCIS
ncbi:MAG: extracellular solute-binding protein [Lachnospiraceae bacterium]|nr:extracellular solute-binding protein [Lachnospiraceae bacterium]